MLHLFHNSGTLPSTKLYTLERSEPKGWVGVSEIMRKFVGPSTDKLFVSFLSIIGLKTHVSRAMWKRAFGEQHDAGTV